MPQVQLSQQPAIDALLYGTRWASGPEGTVLSIGFPGADSTWPAYSAPGEPFQGFASLAEPLRGAVRSALAQWAAAAKLRLEERVDGLQGSVDIRVSHTSWQMGAQQLAYSYLPGDTEAGGDVWLNAALRATLFQTPAPGGLAYFTVLHELGHALGLKHPAEISAVSAALLQTQDNTVFNTVMSTRVWPDVSLTLAGNIDRLPTTLMSLDIDALQYLYGVNDQNHAGNDIYGFDGEGRYLLTIVDAGGVDTLSLTGMRPGTIDLRAGAWSQIGLPVQINGGAIQSPQTVRIHHTSWIENADGGDGADLLIGNALANILRGHGGADTMVGGDGDDSYDVADVGDVVLESGGNPVTGGHDTVRSTLPSFTLPPNVEDIELQQGAVTALGNALDNRLQGNAGPVNYLQGGGGADTMVGGDGNDTYYVDNLGDIVVETRSDRATGGRDTVVSELRAYALGPNVEDLILGAAATTGIGNSLDNYLLGNSAAINYLQGGSGNDTMVGGDGNDTYYVDSTGDGVVETNPDLASGGRDTVVSALPSYALGANVEDLILGGVAPIDGMGNGLKNYIVGNDAANALSGFAGNDWLVGGLGRDTLLGGAGADVFDFNAVADSAGGGQRDIVGDFNRGQGDRIDISGIDADETLAGDQAFGFIGAAAFSAVAGQLRFAGNVLAGDTDGNGVADFEIQLTGVAGLLSGDMVL